MASPFRVLFVCMGNICRSPAADGIFSQMIEDQGMTSSVVIDSAGTGGWHAGNRADSRMRAAAAKRGYDLSSIARQVNELDFESFDLILAMDSDNLSDLEHLKRQNDGKAVLKLFCDFCSDHDETEVPDPYYGGEAGFERVLDLIEDGCEGLLRECKSKTSNG